MKEKDLYQLSTDSMLDSTIICMWELSSTGPSLKHWEFLLKEQEWASCGDIQESKSEIKVFLKIPGVSAGVMKVMC